MLQVQGSGCGQFSTLDLLVASLCTHYHGTTCSHNIHVQRHCITPFFCFLGISIAIPQKLSFPLVVVDNSMFTGMTLPYVCLDNVCSEPLIGCSN